MDLANTNRWRDLISEDFKVLHGLITRLGNTSYLETVSDLRQRIYDPFLFVIVGEVKAGKSSFINALLETEEDICTVAASPMTAKIQQIQYGESHEITDVNEHFQKVFIPEPILKDIAVVDTPGTNSIVENHQEITERFIPVSDLIVFVFEAKNPYRQSAWDFYKFIQGEWRKKIIFILQQKDLMTPEDLETNIDGLTKHAIEKGQTDPKIFAVSALQERKGEKATSGYKVLREFLDKNVTGPKAYLRKLDNYVDTAYNVIQRIDKGIEDRERQLEADIYFRQEIATSLNEQEQLSLNQVDLTISHLTRVYNEICSSALDDIKSGLGFFSMIGKSFGSIFSKKNSPQNWLKDRLAQFEAELNSGMNNAIQKSHTDITSQVKQMIKTVNLQIENSETILKNDHELFSDIARHRESILDELQLAFRKFVQNDNSFAFDSMPGETKSFLPNVAAGGGIAVIGVLISSLTQVMVFDITGGVLSSIGLLFAGVTIGVKKRKLLKKFELEIENGRKRLSNELGPTLKKYIHEIRSRTDAQFERFDKMIAVEQDEVTDLRNSMNDLLDRFKKNKAEIEQALA